MNDSVDKIVTIYFAALTKESFVYNDVVYRPKPLSISTDIFRAFHCPVDCGACCKKYTMDWLPKEPNRPDLKDVTKRVIAFNHKKITVYSDMQEGNQSEYYCRYLNEENGRCGIHMNRALSCDFEPLRFKMHKDGPKNYFGSYPYGRGWNMKRIDDERGAMCLFTSNTDASRKDVIRKLRRLNHWVKHFKLKTKLPEMIEFLDNSFRPRRITI